MVFNSTSTKDSTLDSGFTDTITSLAINSGYTGTITLAATLHITTTYTQAAGSFTASNQTLDVDTTFTLSAGTFTASSGTTYVGSTLTISGSPTFNHNSGTFTFDGTTTATLTCNNVTFNIVSIANTAGTKTVGSTCSFPMGASPTITGGVTLNGTLSGTGTFTNSSSSAMAMNAGASLSGFTGFVRSGSTSTSAFQITGATVDFSSYTTVTLVSFSMTSGSFTAPSGTMTVASTFNMTGGSFNANSGTITFNGVAATLTCNSFTFNAVTLNSGSSTKTVGSGCNLPLGASPTITAVTLNGTLSGSGTLTHSNALTLNSGASLSGFSGFVSNNTLTVAGATADFSGYSTVDLNSTFAMSSGSFTAPSGTMTVGGALTFTGGTFNANSGTVSFDGGSFTLTCNSATFSLVTFTSATSATKTIGSSCTLPLGDSPTLPTTVTITNNGTLSGSGTLTTNTLTMNSGSALSGFTGLSATGLTVAGATLDFSGYTSVVTRGSAGLTITSGTVTAPSSGTINISAKLTISGGTFNANGGTVTFSGTETATLSCGNVTFNLVTFTHTAGTKTVGNDCSLPLGTNPVVTGSLTVNGALIGGDRLIIDSGTLSLNSGSSISGFSALTVNGAMTLAGVTANFSNYTDVDINGTFNLNSGTLTAPATKMSVYGNWNHNGGTFNHNNGTIDLDGDNQTINGSNTFYNLSKSPRGKFNLNIGFDTTQTIVNNLVLRGKSSDQRLALRSTKTGTSWKIDPQAARSVINLDVKDGNNVNGTKFDVAGTGSYDSGNNTNWDFNGPAISSLAPTNLTDGSYGSDTAPTFTFTTADADEGDALSFNIQIDDSSDLGSPIIDYTSGSGTPGNYSFKVGQATAGGSYKTGKEGQTLPDGPYYWRAKVTDTVGNNSDWLTANLGNVSFYIDATAPGAPGKPKADTSKDASKPTWSWSASTDSGSGLAKSDTYSVNWCASSSFVNCDSNSSATASTSFTHTTALADGTWYFRVKAKDAIGLASAYSETGQVSIGSSQSSTSTSTSKSSSSSSESSSTKESTSSETTTEQKIVSEVQIKIVGDNGEPVAGAEVTLYSTPKKAISDQDGIAHFTNVAEGEHRVVIAYGGKVGEKQIVVKAPEVTTSTASPEPVDFVIELKETKPVLSSRNFLLFDIALITILALLYFSHIRNKHGSIINYFRAHFPKL